MFRTPIAAQHERASYLSKIRRRPMLPGDDRGETRRSGQWQSKPIPVCGMQVDTETTDLKYEHDGTTYWFCSRGCMLDFRDDPAKYLDADYKPSM